MGGRYKNRLVLIVEHHQLKLHCLLLNLVGSFDMPSLTVKSICFGTLFALTSAQDGVPYLNFDCATMPGELLTKSHDMIASC
jgi:hypothetical protein